jgi:uncharacterized C2H2 Zn-finger protein
MVFIGPQSRNLSSSVMHRRIQRHTDDGLDARFFRRLIKRHCRIQAIRVRQRDGRHFLLGRRRDDLFRRRHSPQKGVVAVTMQMYEHGSPGPEREEGMPAFRQACLLIQIR